MPSNELNVSAVADGRGGVVFGGEENDVTCEIPSVATDDFGIPLSLIAPTPTPS